jgi:hypothetical protein
MTESTITAKLVAALRATGAIVFKHSDRYRAGVPDLSVTNQHGTWWLEIKYQRGAWISFTKGEFPCHQLQQMFALEQQQPTRVLYAVAICVGSTLKFCVVKPSEVSHCWNVQTVHPYELGCLSLREFVDSLV